MTTLEVHTAYWQSALWLPLVGIGSGMFNSPNTAAMMGAVPAPPPRRRGGRAHAAAEHRRGALDRLRAGGRHLRGAQSDAVRDLLRRHQGLSAAKLAPFIDNMHTALWVLAGVSLVGAVRLPAAPAPRRRAGAPRERVDGTDARRRRSWLTAPVAVRANASGAHCGGRERRRDPADRRSRAPRRHDAAHDPLLRGGRPARRDRRARRRPPPHLHRGRGRAPARGDAPEGAARALARGATRRCSSRGGARRVRAELRREDVDAGAAAR